MRAPCSHIIVCIYIQNIYRIYTEYIYISGFFRFFHIQSWHLVGTSAFLRSKAPCLLRTHQASWPATRVLRCDGRHFVADILSKKHLDDL
jgi:hypothetical protein